MLDELDQFLWATAALVLQKQTVQDRVFRGPNGLAELRLLLCLAEAWYAFGWNTLAEPVAQKAWVLLTSEDLRWGEQTEFACAYASAVGQALPERARPRLEALFQELRGVRDTYSSASHFSVVQFRVVEAVVLAATAGAAAP
jgi:hypothetical protein